MDSFIHSFLYSAIEGEETLYCTVDCTILYVLVQRVCRQNLARTTTPPHYYFSNNGMEQRNGTTEQNERNLF